MNNYVVIYFWQFHLPLHITQRWVIGVGGLVVGDYLKLVEAKQVKCITWDNIVVDSNENIVVRLLTLKDASMPDVILRP